jgi:hypothetical protein
MRKFAARSRSRARALSCACAFALVILATNARADVQAEFEKARAAFSAHSYPDAEARFSALLAPNAPDKLDPSLASQARMYLGASYFLEHRKSDADAVFEKLLIDDSRFDPDPLTFPSDVINEFIDVRAKIRERLNAMAVEKARLEAEKRQRDELERQRQIERLRILEQMASEEKITVRNSRLVATIPFGAGQFQNGKPVLGWLFLGVESALVIATAVTVPIYVSARDSALQEVKNGDPDRKAAQYNNRASDTQIVNLSLVGALGLVIVGGVVQSHVAFVPEVNEMKPRPIPQAKLDSPRILPWIAASPQLEGKPASGFFGLRGTF